jgi:hypothetical protein
MPRHRTRIVTIARAPPPPRYPALRNAGARTLGGTFAYRQTVSFRATNPPAPGAALAPCTRSGSFSPGDGCEPRPGDDGPARWLPPQEGMQEGMARRRHSLTRNKRDSPSRHRAMRWWRLQCGKGVRRCSQLTEIHAGSSRPVTGTAIEWIGWRPERPEDSDNRCHRAGNASNTLAHYPRPTECGGLLRQLVTGALQKEATWKRKPV